MKLWNPFRRRSTPVAKQSTEAPSAARSDEIKEQHGSPAPPKSTRFELPKERAARLLPEYEQQTVTNPQDPEGWFGKAEALAMLNRFEEALAAYEHTLALDAQRPLTLRGKAEGLRSLGQRDAALAIIDNSLAIDPNIALSWRTKGAILRDFGRHEEALSCFEKGLAIDPQDAALWCDKGNALQALRRVDEAMQSYHQASAGHPIATLNQGVRDAREASSRLWKAMQAGEHLIMRLRHEFKFNQAWSEAKPEPPAQIDGERLAMSVRGVQDLERWLALYGFEFHKEMFETDTLMYAQGGEHIDGPVTSLWFDACRLGQWNTSGNHDAWFIPEVDRDLAENQTRQRAGWNRLMELLASRAMNHLAPTLARALAMREVHGRRLVQKMGSSVRNFSACDACGTAMYADIYGGSDDHYRVKLAKPELELLLCTECGRQLQAETAQKPAATSQER